MLETMFEQIVKKIPHGVDVGVSIEIKDFFRGNENVSEYALEVIEGKKYRVFVRLKQYSVQEVKKVFSAFLNFVEYSGASFYIRKIKTECIEYLLFSIDNNNHGFYCQVLFLQ